MAARLDALDQQVAIMFPTARGVSHGAMLSLPRLAKLSCSLTVCTVLIPMKHCELGAIYRVPYRPGRWVSSSHTTISSRLVTM